MLIHGSAITAEIPSDPGFKERFWYWTGASGRKYIHSVYGPESCPPLPGAIYVAVRREGPLRIALAVGRFAPAASGLPGRRDAQRLRASGIDEIHVHLLSKSAEAAERTLDDLRGAFVVDADDMLPLPRAGQAGFLLESSAAIAAANPCTA